MFEPGDIVLLKRQKRSGLMFAWILFKQIWTFFFVRVGLIEAVSKWYHIEMYFDAGLYITMEPPECRLISLSNIPVRVYRLKNKPVNFEIEFYKYCNEKFGEMFDYWKFWAMMADRIFGTRWFTRHFVNPAKDVCAEFVSRFYKERIGIPITIEDPEGAVPSDVNEYCSSKPNIFEMVYDSPI